MRKESEKDNREDVELSELEDIIAHTFDMIEYVRASGDLTASAELYKDVYDKVKAYYDEFPSEEISYSVDFYSSIKDQFDDILKLIEKQNKKNKISAENEKILVEIKTILGHHLNELKDFHDKQDYKSAYESAKKALKLLKIEDKISPTYETKLQIAKVYQNFVEIYIHYNSSLSIKKTKKAIDNSVRYAKEALKMYRGKESLNILSESYKFLVNFAIEFGNKDSEIERNLKNYLRIIDEMIETEHDNRNYLPEKKIKVLADVGNYFFENEKDQKAILYYEKLLSEMDSYIDKFKVEDEDFFKSYRTISTTLSIIKDFV